jgi:Mn2+/Fe2+ NRAMP family transporter
MMKRLKNIVKRILVFLWVMGPAFITSVADNDASGVASYTVAGARTGYSLLSVLTISTLLLIGIQEMSARLGIVTGRGLTEIIRETYGVQIGFFCLLLHIITTFSTAVAEIAGIAGSMELLGVSRFIAVPLFTIGLFFIIYFWNYKSLEKFFLSLTVFYFCYFISALLVKPDWGEIIYRIFVPDIKAFLKREGFYLSIIIIGTTITPWMQYYLQSSVVEKGIRKEHIPYVRWEVIIGAFATQFFALFMMVCAGEVLYPYGIRVETVEEAGMALKPLAGKYFYLLFSIGFLNASLMGALILPISSAYAICEFFGWEGGVNKTFQEASHFYITLALYYIFGAMLVLIPGMPLITLMLVSQFLNGILLPLLIFLMLKVANSEEVMGDLKNSPFSNFIAIFTVAVVIIATFFTIFPMQK